jgi:hypothetical protein
MPPKTEEQARFMRAAAHNKDFAKRAKIPQRVAKKFLTDDAGAKRKAR